MISISLCMIVKNEEAVLARCLNSVKNIVDEIVIVDTGSSDSTISIAQQFTNQIFEFEWIDDFSAARNFSFSKATKDYILWLDADDVLLPDDQQKFLELKSNMNPNVDTVRMVYALSRDQQGRIVNSLYRNRLVKTSRNFQWTGVVHELLHVYGKSLVTDICISHMKMQSQKTDRNLKLYEALLEKGKELSPRDLFYYANECFEHRMYERAVKYYRHFLDTKQGWAEDCIRACELAAEAFLQSEKTAEAENILYESFHYDSPRANICCKLGYIYLYLKKNYRQALYWYKAATESDLDYAKSTGSLINTAFYTWLPHLQLCVCYDKIGKHRQAYYHNEIASLYEIDHPSILSNKSYFSSVLTKKQMEEVDDEIRLYKRKMV